ncbi:Uncharacterised protein [Edwardsiella hoshinae]|uniref:Uncharacterized protein n=1 Tax=Edwardsiella hoshinae TaxID=93378 RepID=A0A376DGZ4_9GAMM|nr:Uncharacterised protein [Edwardsiella hoshinae]
MRHVKASSRAPSATRPRLAHVFAPSPERVPLSRFFVLRFLMATVKASPSNG